MLFRRPRIVGGSFGILLVATMLYVIYSARYESHFMVLLRRGRYDPVVSSQSASPMDFTRHDITEEELNSEVELLRDQDLLMQVVRVAGLIPADIRDSERACRDRICRAQIITAVECRSGEKVEPDPGRLQGQRSRKSSPRTLSPFQPVRAKAYESPAAAGRDPLL